MLLHLPNSCKLFLLDILNDIWLKSAELEALKNVVTVPILKHGKDPELASSYRPISLLSCVLKTLERMIKNRLEWWLNNTIPLPHCQFDFKKDLGTRDAVTYLVTDIQNNFSNNTYLGALFLDLKGAYDCINLDILLTEMIKLSIPGYTAQIIVNLYKHREVYLRRIR